MKPGLAEWAGSRIEQQGLVQPVAGEWEMLQWMAEERKQTAVAVEAVVQR